MKRLLPRVLLALGLAGVALLVFVYRPAFTPALRGPAAVAALEAVDLGGSPQWILVRGRDRTKPIVLFLHGGPGLPSMFLAHRFQRPLERDFVVVHWDRHSGKSFDDGVEPSHLRTSRQRAEVVELIELLQRRYGARPVILVGHSYGSYLGVEVARARPDLVRALVGVGQVACTPEAVQALTDAWIAQAAERAGDDAAAAEARAGGAYDRTAALFRYGGQVRGMSSGRELLGIGLTAPEYNGRDMLRLQQGLSYILPRFVRDGAALPLWESVRRLSVPTYVFAGRFDAVTTPACAERWLAGLEAPRKRFVWFERSAHYPFLEQPEAFRRELLQVARDTAAASPPPD